MRTITLGLIGALLVLFNSTLYANDFYLDSPRNKGTLRFEIDNDVVWDEDSNFSNGWSLQYHTVRYSSWDETGQPGFINWVGKHFPTLGDANSIVRNVHAIGQNIVTPGDITAEVPQEGDLPYAGTLTYTINWQSYNRRTARIFQISAGVLGEESLAEQFQKFVHNDLGAGKDPKGWDTQRKSEPILNLAYQYIWRLAHMGAYNNGWAGQLALAPVAQLGNLLTAAELGLAFRFGWNMLEGFNTFPAPPGRGLFQAMNLPKPENASPHGVEFVFGARGTWLGYSVIYDGSKLTSDERKVERENYYLAGLFGINYHYYNFLSIRLAGVVTSDILVEEFIPEPPPGKDKTAADNSYGTLIIDFHF